MFSLFRKIGVLAHLPHVVSILLLVLVVALKITHTPLLSYIQLKVFDQFQQWHPRFYEDLPVKIVDIDDESLQKIGQWPWPRNKVAELVTTLQNAGAAVIVFDIVFSEPDRTSPKQLRNIWPDNHALEELSVTLPDYDVLFAEAIHQANVVTGFVLTNQQSEAKPQQKAGYVIAGDSPFSYIPAFHGAILPLSELEGNAAGNGALNSIPDEDGVVRKVPLIYQMDGKLYPSLAMEALRVAQGASTYIIKSVGANGEESFGSHTGVTHVKNGEFVVPATADGQLWVYYTPYHKERYIPAWKMLSPEFDASHLAGQIILIGTSALGLRDTRATPLSVVTSGVEIHAQAIEQIISGVFLSRPDWIEGAELSVMVCMGLLLIYLMRKITPIWQAVFMATVLAATGSAAWYAYLHFHLLIDPVIPGITIMLVYLAESLHKFLVVEHERKTIRNAFSHYVSPEMVSRLASHPEKLALGGEMKEMTVLFADIRGFTSLSETLDAKDLTGFMNSFLTPMTEAILKHHGTIDKYIGDCIMAFWNAPLDNPNHATDASHAALAMLEAVKRFNQEQPITIQLGIGVGTGMCCVGNMGSKQRFDYSVLGDAVNLTSRLEGQTGYYGVDVIVSESTKEKAGHLAFLELDCVRMKGKSQPVRIFALLGNKTLAQKQSFQVLAAAMEQFHQLYRAGDWYAAKAQLRSCLELAIAVDEHLPLKKLAEIFFQRIEHFLQFPPQHGWDGVFTAEMK